MAAAAPTTTTAAAATATASEVVEPSYVIPYLPQKKRRDWVGIAVPPPDSRTSTRLQYLLDTYVNHAARDVTYPQFASCTVEYYHRTVYHGLDEASTYRAERMIRLANLSYELDLRPVVDGRDQQKLRIVYNPTKRLAMVIAEFHASPGIAAIQDAIDADPTMRAKDGKSRPTYTRNPPHVTIVYVNNCTLRLKNGETIPDVEVKIQDTPAVVTSDVKVPPPPSPMEGVTTATATTAAAVEDVKQPDKPLVLFAVDVESTGHVGAYDLLSIGWFAVEIPRVITFDIAGRMTPPPIIRSRGRVSMLPTRPFEERCMKQFWSQHSDVLNRLLKEAGPANVAMRTFFHAYDQQMDRAQVIPLSDCLEHDMGFINRYAHTVLGRPPMAFSADASVYVGSVGPDEFVYERCVALYGTLSRTFSAMCYERVKAHIDARSPYTHLPDDDARNVAWLSLAKLYSCGPALGTDFESRAKSVMQWIDSAVDESTAVTLPSSPSFRLVPRQQYHAWSDVVAVIKELGAKMIAADDKRGIDTKAGDYEVSDETIANVKHPMLSEAEVGVTETPWWTAAWGNTNELDEPVFKAKIAAIDAAVAAVNDSKTREAVLILDTEGLSARPADLPVLQIGNLIVDAVTMDEKTPLYAGTAVCKLPIGSKMDHRTLMFWYRKNMAILENYVKHPEHQLSPFQMAVWQAHLLRAFDGSLTLQRAGDGGLVYDYEQIDQLAEVYAHPLVAAGYRGLPYWKLQIQSVKRMRLPRHMEQVVAQRQRAQLQVLAKQDRASKDVLYGGVSLNDTETIYREATLQTNGHTHDALDDVKMVAARARVQMDLFQRRLAPMLASVNSTAAAAGGGVAAMADDTPASAPGPATAAAPAPAPVSS